MTHLYKNPEINKMANEIISLMPSLAGFFEKTETLSQYSKAINNTSADVLHLRRQVLFKKILHNKIFALFNTQEKESLKVLIPEDEGLVQSIVEHHGIIDPPGFLSIPLIANFYKLFNSKKDKDIINFATGTVALNEYFRRRGLLFHQKKINLYPKEDRNKILFRLPAIEFDLLKLSKANGNLSHFNKDELSFLEKINEVIKDIDFSSCRFLGDQLTKINFYLWPYLFDENLRPNIPNLISVEYDSVIIEFLLHVLRNDNKCFIYQMLFDPSLRQIILEQFQDVVGAWNESRGTGTHFFWLLDEKHRKKQLFLKDNFLITLDGTKKIAFDEKSIIDNIASNEIFPGLFLKFALIIFYMGMKPLLGQGSLGYLSSMKEKLTTILEKDYPDEANFIRQVALDALVFFSVCKEITSQNQIRNIHALDIIYNGGYSKDYFDRLDTVPYNHFLAPSLLLLHEYLLKNYGNHPEVGRYSLEENDLQNVLQEYLIT